MIGDLHDWLLALDVREDVSPDDLMYHPGFPGHYFGVGRSAIRVIMGALLARMEYFGGDAPLGRILDFGCGHGRVARYLRAAFPDAEIAVCDYDPGGPAWCARHFGCRPITDPQPASYDLIWLGSVFTHLPASISERVLGTVAAALRPNGVLIFTLQGRFAQMRDEAWPDRPAYGLGREPMDQIVAGLRREGYGFAEYPGQVDYGVTMIDPAWFQRRLLATAAFTQIGFQEKGWDNHQDVLAFMRIDLLEERKGTDALLTPADIRARRAARSPGGR